MIARNLNACVAISVLPSHTEPISAPGTHQQLSQVSLFQSLAADLTTRIEGHTHSRASGELFFNDGDWADAFFTLRSGCATPIRFIRVAERQDDLDHLTAVQHDIVADSKQLIYDGFREHGWAHALESGFQTHLNKPVEPATLAVAIAALVHRLPGTHHFL
jgi:hypothetical protein